MVLLCPFANVELAFLELFYGHVSERELADRLEVGIYIYQAIRTGHSQGAELRTSKSLQTLVSTTSSTTFSANASLKSTYTGRKQLCNLDSGRLGTILSMFTTHTFSLWSPSCGGPYVGLQVVLMLLLLCRIQTQRVGLSFVFPLSPLIMSSDLPLKTDG